MAHLAATVSAAVALTLSSCSSDCPPGHVVTGVNLWAGTLVCREAVTVMAELPLPEGSRITLTGPATETRP